MGKDEDHQSLAVSSREYKLILSPDRFADREAGAEALRDLIHLLVSRQQVDVEDQADEETRRTYYLDTFASHLNHAGFALRVRYEQEEDAYKIALKYRAPDRYLAASKNVRSSKDKNGSVKFEEDILPPFRSVFSRSSSIWCDELPKLDTLDDAAQLFPGLAALDIPKKTKLAKANGFEAHEVFRKLCILKFKNKKTKTKVKLGLSFWYHTQRDRWPLIAECAFDYKAHNGDDFPLDVVEATGKLFCSLQNQPGWFNSGATTKTRYVYEGLT